MQSEHPQQGARPHLYPYGVFGEARRGDDHGERTPTPGLPRGEGLRPKCEHPGTPLHRTVGAEADHETPLHPDGVGRRVDLGDRGTAAQPPFPTGTLRRQGCACDQLVVHGGLHDGLEEPVCLGRHRRQQLPAGARMTGRSVRCPVCGEGAPNGTTPSGRWAPLRRRAARGSPCWPWPASPRCWGADGRRCRRRGADAPDWQDRGAPRRSRSPRRTRRWSGSTG